MVMSKTSIASVLISSLVALLNGFLFTKFLRDLVSTHQLAPELVAKFFPALFLLFVPLGLIWLSESLGNYTGMIYGRYGATYID